MCKINIIYLGIIINSGKDRSMNRLLGYILSAPLQSTGSAYAIPQCEGARQRQVRVDF